MLQKLLHDLLVATRSSQMKRRAPIRVFSVEVNLVRSADPILGMPLQQLLDDVQLPILRRDVQRRRPAAPLRNSVRVRVPCYCQV